VRNGLGPVAIVDQNEHGQRRQRAARRGRIRRSCLVERPVSGGCSAGGWLWLGGGWFLAGDLGQDVLGLPVDQPGDELLGAAEQERVGQDLRLAVELGQAGDEPAADEQQADQGQEGTRRSLSRESATGTS
jgi:hypothetical protein